MCRAVGNSMAPTIVDGSFLVLHCWLRIKVGSVVFVEHPNYGDIVKRVASISDLGMLTLRGDDPASISEQQIGPCDKAWLVGTIIKIIKPPR